MAQKTRKLHKKTKNKTKLCNDKIVHLAYYILVKKIFGAVFVGMYQMPLLSCNDKNNTRCKKIGLS